MKHHVTVGVDGSPESRAAARWGAREAALREVPLRLVHAVDWLISPAYRGWAAKKPTVGPTRRSPTHWKTCDAGIPGWRPRRDVSQAGQRQPRRGGGERRAARTRLRGVGGLVGFLIGSVSLSTLVATETPVVLVRVSDAPEEAEPSRYGEIVLGIDIHEAADKVLTFAFEEADRRGCALRAVHGWKMPSMYQYAPFFDPENEREVGRSVTVMLDDMLMPWRHKFPSVCVTHEAFMGPAGEQLVQAAARADLVVVGRRLRRSPLGVHLGSVAHAVLHHAAAPVAVIAHD